jgi:hypothetical protein
MIGVSFEPKESVMIEELYTLAQRMNPGGSELPDDRPGTVLTPAGRNTAVLVDEFRNFLEYVRAVTMEGILLPVWLESNISVEHFADEEEKLAVGQKRALDAARKSCLVLNYFARKSGMQEIFPVSVDADDMKAGDVIGRACAEAYAGRDGEVVRADSELRDRYLFLIRDAAELPNSDDLLEKVSEAALSLLIYFSDMVTENFHALLGVAHGDALVDAVEDGICGLDAVSEAVGRGTFSDNAGPEVDIADKNRFACAFVMSFFVSRNLSEG